MSFSLIEACRGILKIPSCSSENPREHLGNEKVVRYLAKTFADKLNIKIFSAQGRPRDKTLIVWPKNLSFPNRGGLALHTHLDTVPPGGISQWKIAKPFSGAKKGKYLIGLGAADVKCDSLCKISALLSNKISSRSPTPFFVGSFSEEVGMYGMKWIANEKVISPQWALVGEPSEGHLSFANKGFASLEGEIRFRPQTYGGKSVQKSFQGKSAHSSAPHLSVSALEAFLNFLSQNPEAPIGEFSGSTAINIIPGNFEISSSRSIIPSSALKELSEIWKQYRIWSQSLLSIEQNPLFTPSTATSAWTILRREGNRIFFSMDFRFLPGQSPEKLMKKLKWPHLKLKTESFGFYQNPKDSFGRLLRPLLGKGKKFITKSGANEAYYYQQMGTQAFVHAPGVSYGNIHSPDEKIAIADLVEAQAFYTRTVEKLCSS